MKKNEKIMFFHEFALQSGCHGCVQRNGSKIRVLEKVKKFASLHNNKRAIIIITTAWGPSYTKKVI
jgi:hypothetical protein